MDFDEFAFDEVEDHMVPDTQIHDVHRPPTSHVPTGIFEPTASSDYGPTDEVDAAPFRSKTIRQWLSTPFNKLPKTVLPQDSDITASAAARELVGAHRKEEEKKRFAGPDAPPAQPMPPRRYPRKPRTAWTATETTTFYDGLQKFGTDFSLIAVLLPGKSRDLIRLKYKYEEERSPTAIHEALASPKMDIDLTDFDERLEVQRNYKSQAVAPLSADEQAMLDEMVSPTKEAQSADVNTTGAQQPNADDNEDIPLFQLNSLNQPERTVSDDFAFDAFDETSPIGDQIPISQLALPPPPKVGRPATKRVAVKRERAPTTTTTTTTTTTSTLQNSASLQQQAQAFDDFSI